MRCGEYQTIIFRPKDRYGNLATVDCRLLQFEATSVVQKNYFATHLHIMWSWWLQGEPNVHMVATNTTLHESDEGGGGYYCLQWKIDTPGYYRGCVKYDGSTVGLRNVQIFCLTGDPTMSSTVYLPTAK